MPSSSETVASPLVPPRQSRPGFTLLELIAVIAIIAIVSALAIPRASNMRETAALNSTAAAFQNLRSAFQLYYADNLGFPLDTTGSPMPSVMSTYLQKSIWDRGPAIGGKWDWNGIDKAPWKSLGQNNISIWQPTPLPTATTMWERFDNIFDDGSMTLGQFRVFNSGRNYCCSVEP